MKQNNISCIESRFDELSEHWVMSPNTKETIKSFIRSEITSLLESIPLDYDHDIMDSWRGSGYHQAKKEIDNKIKEALK